MRIYQYNRNNAEKVRHLMESCSNYAPEYVGVHAGEDDLSYIEDSFFQSNDGGKAYIVCDDAGMAVSFITCTVLGQRWYITGLYVNADRDAEANALASLNLLASCIQEPGKVCINVNPAATDIVAFWENNHYVLSPEYSVFTNADNEKISSYVVSVSN